MQTTPRRGLGLIEILIAVVLVALLGAAVATTLVRGSARSADTVARESARHLAATWVERIRAAGPFAYDLDRDSFPVSVQGERLLTGESPYSVLVVRDISCLGAVETGDAGLAGLDPGCTGSGREPVVTYRVSAFHPLRSGAAGVVALATSFGETSGAGGGARSCAGGQRWDGSACVCPAGTTFDGTVCGCPAGQTWNGTACVTTSCSIAGGTARTRELATCASPRVGATIERQDIDAATCAWGPWTLVSATCGCPNPGEVYAAATNRCFVPPPPQTRARECPAGFTGSITDRQVYDVVADAWGPWVEISNTCVAAPCTPAIESRPAPCPPGFTGEITEQRVQNATCSAWGEWAEVANSCAEITTYSPPSVMLMASATRVTVGQDVTFTPTWTQGSEPIGWRSVTADNGASEVSGGPLTTRFLAAGVYSAVANVRDTLGVAGLPAYAHVEVVDPPPVMAMQVEEWSVTGAGVPVFIGGLGSLPHGRHSWVLRIYRYRSGWAPELVGEARVTQTAGACAAGSGANGIGQPVSCPAMGWHTMIEHMGGDWPYPTGPFFVEAGRVDYPWADLEPTSPLIDPRSRWYGITHAY